MKTRLYMRLMDETADSTVSSLFALDPSDDSIRNKFLGFIIEDGPRAEKEVGRTRIPSGIYKLHKRIHGGFFKKYATSWKHEWVPELLDVPGFSDILIHVGNTVMDTRGCLLPNRSIMYNVANDTYYGSESANTYQQLYRYLHQVWGDDDEVELEIVRR